MNRILGIFLVSVLLSSCIEKDDVNPEEDNELITRVSLHIKEHHEDGKDDENESDDSDDHKFTYHWRDNNGDGIVDSVDPIKLELNKEYEVEVEFWNDLVSPSENISEEVEEAGDIHLVKLKVIPNGFLSIQVKDKDKNNKELGLENHLRPNAKGNAVLNVILFHQPPVNGTPVKDGFSELGSTDIDVKFDVVVE
jgi:hypothetical protein